MPKAVDIDWHVARGLAAQGFAAAQIARKLNCNAGTIRSRACREKWNDLAAKTQELMQQDPESDEHWRNRAKNWPKRVASLMEKRLSYLESLDPKKLSMKELKELSTTTAETDAMARKAFELDEQRPAMRIGLFLPVETEPEPAIDIQSVPTPPCVSFNPNSNALPTTAP